MPPLRFVVTLLACACALTASRVPSVAADCASSTGAGRVFYVTDREALDSDQLFSGERGLNADHEPIVSYGTVGAPASRGTLAPCGSGDVFLAAIGKRFAAKERRVLIYVHGYYTTFRTAVDDAIAMQRALKFAGPVVAYSWPSKVTSRLAYINDESNASWSLGDFRSLLDRVLAKYPGAKISFASHSLGSRFAAEGIAFVRRGCASCVGPDVFFAPDIDGDTLRSELKYAARCHGRPPEKPAAAAPVTVYVSNKDVALRQSQQLHGHQRAGQAGSEMILCKGIDTIDVSYYKGSDKAGHSYQVDPPVVDDARAAFAGISPAAPSRNLTRATRPGGTYYELRR